MCHWCPWLFYLWTIGQGIVLKSSDYCPSNVTYCFQTYLLRQFGRVMKTVNKVDSFFGKMFWKNFFWIVFWLFPFFKCHFNVWSDCIYCRILSQWSSFVPSMWHWQEIKVWNHQFKFNIFFLLSLLITKPNAFTFNKLFIFVSISNDYVIKLSVSCTSRYLMSYNYILF